MKNTFVLLKVLVIAVLAIQCSEQNPVIPEGSADKEGFVQLDIRLSKAVVQRIDKVVAIAEHPLLGTVRGELTIEGTKATGSLEVPPGSGWVVIVEAYIGDVLCRIGRSDAIDIVAGQVVPVVITVVRFGIEAGRGIDEVSLGDDADQVVKAWGKPDKIDTQESGYSYWYYTRAVAVLLDSNLRVVMMMAFNRYTRHTEKGLKIGDPKSLMLSLYGEPYEMKHTEDLGDVYLYPSLGVNFWIKDDKVDAVTVYIPYTPRLSSSMLGDMIAPLSRRYCLPGRNPGLSDSRALFGGFVLPAGHLGP